MGLVDADDCVLREGEFDCPDHHEQDEGCEDDVSRAPPPLFEGGKGCHSVRGVESFGTSLKMFSPPSKLERSRDWMSSSSVDFQPSGSSRYWSMLSN